MTILILLNLIIFSFCMYSEEEKRNAGIKKLQNKRFVQKIMQYEPLFDNFVNGLFQEIENKSNYVANNEQNNAAEVIVKCITNLIQAIYQIDSQEQFDLFQKQLRPSLQKLLKKTKKESEKKDEKFIELKKNKNIIGDLINWEDIKSILKNNNVSKEEIRAIYNTKIEFHNTSKVVSEGYLDKTNGYESEYITAFMRPINITI